MADNLSWRHHYIPQFYLKGFVNANNKLAIYDKLNDKIKDGEYSTRTHFFEEHRNITTINGIKSDFIETVLYKDIDDTIAKLFDDIRTKDANYLTPKNLFTLKMFISFLFWRIPKNDKLLNEFIDNYDFENLGFTIVDKITKEKASDEVITRFKNEPAFRKVYSFILPYSTFKIDYQEEDETKWKSISNNSEGLHLTSDNPVMTLLKDRFYEKDQKILFPVTSQKLLYYGDTNKAGHLPREFYLHADVATIHFADRYVCGPNKSYLEKIIELYKLRVRFNKTEQILTDLFSFLE